ncbi:hypothetical protein Ptr902_04146 [Pyrenophora tritici-repentis]|uniref:Uncharacterized protein n=1 Tax=Pyrenophora tritici-repentis TaxID=45151 RepID=A0A5M9LAI9_9PLEO|nr:hypothetical protein PtrV1_07303 [Pyrenophora tritici-repentis]KAF7448364.1 hypothetical protein A1F99_077280 [Pyrenophora tritici-repentis]KAF7572079.1 hypothetical protein PtrM4_095790 [Pyrenophora tritici-repentis]KAI0582397.1 hypothetical protein Alg215_04137 [Pyrenophora tritici-repentis]KAI2477377.1 hypothetical protein Ptr902_11450 [Pyrenophora tritici-repentis]
MKLASIIATAILAAHPTIAAFCLGGWITCSYYACDASCPNVSSGCGCTDYWGGVGNLEGSHCIDRLSTRHLRCPWTGHNAPSICNPAKHGGCGGFEF